MSTTMLFGPLGHMLPIPYPQSGMGWDHGRNSEETALLSGGRHIYTAPTPFRRYKLSYSGGTAGLQNIVDIYNGVYGKGPFYLLDINFTSGNQLPTRWASAYMLRHVAGAWCAPVANESTVALAGETVMFSNSGLFPAIGISQILPTVPGQPAYLRIWGTRTGTASVRVSLRNASTGVWGAATDVVPSATPSATEVISAAAGTAGTYDAIKLELYCPEGSTLTLDHLNLTSGSGDSTRVPGLGIGAVKFSSDLGGTIITKRFDRIGLSVDLLEIES
jgi:hypothetical protein